MLFGWYASNNQLLMWKKKVNNIKYLIYQKLNEFRL